MDDISTISFLFLLKLNQLLIAVGVLLNNRCKISASKNIRVWF